MFIRSTGTGELSSWRVRMAIIVVK